MLRPKTEPKIDPEMVAKALGAERVERPRYLLTNDPNAEVVRQMMTPKEVTGHRIELAEEDWKKLCELAQEFKEGEKPLSPELVGLQLLRQALELLEVKAQFKVRLYASAQAKAV